ncbi:MAG: AraC family transcriptional regulator, partial [Spirochaetaceae bacterium]|nr:AraC family transcriptional regulator [Spirochaetaceae bacterium]
TGSEIIYAVYYNTSPSLAELLGNKSRNVKLDPLSFSYIHKLMEKMIREFEKEEIGFEIALNASAEDLLVYLLRIPKKDIENINREKNEINSKMMKIAEFINDHYQEELTLNTLSDQFYISSSYLSRSFHKETGFSLIEYINNIRILKVKEQLISTNDSISTISERCGFGSVTNFGRIFKSITEMSPREYRKKQIAGL